MLREFYHICSAFEKNKPITKRKILILEENKKEETVESDHDYQLRWAQ